MSHSTRHRPDDDTLDSRSLQPTDAPTTEIPDEEKKKPPFELSITQVVGGALAAMTAAALGSTLGVGGTILGAAFASVVAGVAGSLYTASLRRTHDRVKTVFIGRGSATESLVVEEAAPAVPLPSSAPRHAESADRHQDHGTRRRRLPWKGALIAALSVFALAAIAITGVEALTGRSFSGGQGTTVQQVGGAKAAPRSTEPSAAPTPSATAPTTSSPTPEPEASGSASAEPTLSSVPAPSSAEPTPSGSASAPQEAPSTAPTLDAEGNAIN